MQKNDIVELKIEDLDINGSGIGRFNGLCVFVPDAVPGEVVSAKIIKLKKSFAVGKVEEIKTPSPARIKPKCSVYKKCGGCSLAHIAYPMQLEWKQRRVSDCLRRIGGIDAPVEFTLPSAEQYRYRNKGAFPMQMDGLLKIGFYERRSHDIADVADCLLQSRDTALLISQLRTWIVHNKISVYDEQTGAGLLRHAVVRTAQNRDMMLILCINGDDIPCKKELLTCVKYVLPQLKSIMLSIQKSGGNVILGEKTVNIYGADFICETLLGVDFKISANSFMQVNTKGAETLYRTLFDLLELKKNDAVADLYCGAGTISLCAAQRCGFVYGAEIVPEAVADAKENARRNGIENAEFFCGDTGDVFPKIIEKAGKIDAIIVDPPRKGLEEKVILDCAATGAAKIGYVSCDPASLARDLKLFTQNGYEVKKVVPVDMFPQTAHVETVVLLQCENS